MAPELNEFATANVGEQAVQSLLTKNRLTARFCPRSSPWRYLPQTHCPRRPSSAESFSPGSPMYCFRALLLSAVIALPAAAASPGYFRQPAVHGETVVFVAEGDLWSVPITGGRANRLTTHPGAEGRPAISPDGRYLAYTARYEGPVEVYVMPLAGGRPRRLTFDAAAISHVGWTPDGKVLVGTNARAGLPAQQLEALDIAAPGAVIRHRIPLAQAADGSYWGMARHSFHSPGFSRQPHPPLQGRHRPAALVVPRRRAGSTAAHDRLPGHEQVADAVEGPSLFRFGPGRHDEPVVDEAGRQRAATAHETQGFRPGIALAGCRPDRLPAGRQLSLFDIAAAKDNDISITLDSDFDQTREKWVKDPIGFLSDAHPSPDGKSVVVTARGRAFVIPRKGGRLVEIRRKPGVRFRDARFMPDGKSVVLFSDESGEVEVWTASANGLGDMTRLTSDGSVLRRKAVPSPDGKYVAHTDKNFRLFLLNIQSKENKQLAESPSDEFSRRPRLVAGLEVARLRRGWRKPISPGDALRSYGWQNHAGHVRAVRQLQSGIQSGWGVAVSPVGSQPEVAGASPWGPYQPEPFFDKKTKKLPHRLTSGLRSPFTAPNELDSAEKDEPKPNGTKKPDEDKEAKKVPTRFDRTRWHRLALLIPVPVPPGNYRDLEVNDKALFWFSSHPGEDRDGNVSRSPSAMRSRE